MLSLMPISYYRNSSNDNGTDSKYAFNKKSKPGNAEKRKRKNTAEDLIEPTVNAKVEKKRKMEQSTYDPSNYQSVVDIRQAAKVPALVSAVSNGESGGKHADAPVLTLNTTNSSDSMDVLRQKLQAKIANSLQKRNADPQGDKPKRQKKEKKPKKPRVRTPKVPAQEVELQDKPNQTHNNNKESPRVVQDDTEYDFQFGRVKEEAPASNPDEKKRTKAVLLRELERKEKKLKKLAAEDPEQAKEIRKAQAMEASLMRLQGVKVKDDPKRLKVTLKKKEKQKEKSRVRHKEQSKALEKSMAAKQVTRAANIAARMTKGKKRMQQRIQRTKNRPGFEGANSGFLN